MLVSFLTHVTIVTGEKSRHFSDDIIMIVVHVQINSLVLLWTPINELIAIFFGHNINLIISQVRLEVFGLINSAQTERHAGILVKFPCQAHLQWSRCFSK